MGRLISAMMVSVIQPRGWVTDEDKARLLAAINAREVAEVEVRDAILAATRNGASVRELAAVTGFSATTIQKYRQEAK